MPENDIDVLIVNYHTGHLAVAAAARLSEVADVSIWDNSGEILESRGGRSGNPAIFGCGRNVLYARASNEIYARSTNPFVLLLNPDALVTAADVLSLRQALVAEPGAWGVAPRLVNDAGDDQEYRRRLPTTTMLLADRGLLTRPLLRRAYERLYCADLDPSSPGPVEQPAAACLMLRRELVDVPLFDEAYPLFGNDTDLARRMNERGYCLYAPHIVVKHIGGASIARACRDHRSWIRAQYDAALRRYARRHLRGSVVLEPLFFVRLCLERIGRGRRPPEDLAA
jgi:GT2 family glycosyltransferase